MTAFLTQYYAFGDSLSNNGRVLRETGYDPTGPIAGLFGIVAPGIYEGSRFSNAPNYTEVIPGLVGAPYVPAHDLAVGGAMSDTSLPIPSARRCSRSVSPIK